MCISCQLLPLFKNNNVSLHCESVIKYNMEQKKPVRVLYNPCPWSKSQFFEPTPCVVVDSNVINEHFYFLLLMPDNTFREVRAEHCEFVTPKQ